MLPELSKTPSAALFSILEQLGQHQMRLCFVPGESINRYRMVPKQFFNRPYRAVSDPQPDEFWWGFRKADCAPENQSLSTRSRNR
jgi:hypothetical protein